MNPIVPSSTRWVVQLEAQEVERFDQVRAEQLYWAEVRLGQVLPLNREQLSQHDLIYQSFFTPIILAVLFASSIPVVDLVMDHWELPSLNLPLSGSSET